MIVSYKHINAIQDDFVSHKDHPLYIYMEQYRNTDMKLQHKGDYLTDGTLCINTGCHRDPGMLSITLHDETYEIKDHSDDDSCINYYFADYQKYYDCEWSALVRTIYWESNIGSEWRPYGGKPIIENIIEFELTNSNRYYFSNARKMIVYNIYHEIESISRNIIENVCCDTSKLLWIVVFSDESYKLLSLIIQDYPNVLLISTIDGHKIYNVHDGFKKIKYPEAECIYRNAMRRKAKSAIRT